MTLEFNQAEESVISIDNVIGNIDLSLSVESSSVEAMPVDVVLSASNELSIEVVLDKQEVPLSVTMESQMALEVAITTNDSIDFTVDVNTDTNKGDRGDTGEAGPQGPRGPRGDKGDMGDLGATGATGPAGSTGLDGVKGDKGDKGDLGLTGAKGDKGDQGNQGFKGDKGDTGPAGVKGDQGVQGIQGRDGLTTSVNGVTQIDGNVTLTKSGIGLGNVDDTSDLNKPISTATQSALDLKLETSLKGAANGLAELDSSGFVKNSQLPSYVDDVLEYSSLSLFPAVGESGKIYIDTATNLTYRWSGSIYALISSSLALGETSSTAYRGDRGKTAYDHSQIILGNPHNVSKADVGLSNVPNLSFSGSNTGDQTLSGLGGQPKLNGTGFVKASGTAISYDNSTYEPALSKNTAFNKNFGTTTGTVLEGRTFGTAANSAVGDFQPTITGLTTNYIPKWNGSNFVNSLISDLAGNITVNLDAVDGRGLYVYSAGANNDPYIKIGRSGGLTDVFNIGVRGSTGNNAMLSLFGQSGSSTGLHLMGNGDVKISTTTPSTSPTNGALVVNGGIGVGGNGYFNGDVNCGNIIATSSNSNFISSDISIGYNSYQGYRLAVNGTGFFNGPGIFNGYLSADYLKTKSSSVLQVFNGGTSSNQLRWDLEREGTETGSNTGSYLRLYRYADDGSFMGHCLTIERASGNSTFTGNVTASNFILSSDRTLKTNIQPIIKDYSKLNLVSFNFKTNLDELRFGTIAQDLISNGYSEFVTGDKEGDYKVKYIDLIIAKLASAELRIKELEDKYGSR